MKENETDDGRKYTMRARAKQVRQLGDRILNAALEAFSTNHFVDVKIASVAEAAGCSEQTIYRRYGSKEGLFRAMAERVGEQLQGDRGAVAPGDVDAAVARVVKDYEKSGDAMVLLQAQEDRVEVMAEATQRGRDNHHAWVDTIFGEVLGRVNAKTRRRVHGELVVALDVQTWKRLRRNLGFSRKETEAAMRNMTHAIVASVANDEETG